MPGTKLRTILRSHSIRCNRPHPPRAFVPSAPITGARAACAAAGLLFMACSAHAQPTAPDSTARAAALLQTITVWDTPEAQSAGGPFPGVVAKRSATGTRTDTPLIETPQSISVVGAEELTTRRAQSLQDALGYVAGVTASEGADRTADAFVLRGFATDNIGSVLRDGSLYTVNFYNGRQEPYGLERIELLKGAASVLYGSAAPGGVINTVSKRPLATPLREINVETGSWRRKQVSGDFSGALDADATWSYRLTFLRRNSDTFIDSVPDDRSYIAPALTWRPSAATSLTFLAEYQRDRTAYIDGLPAEGTLLPNVNGRLPRNRFTGEPGYDRFALERYSIGYLFEHAFNDRLKIRNSLRYFHADNAFDYVWGWGLDDTLRTTMARGAQDRWDRSSAITSDTSLQYDVSHGKVRHTMLLGLDYSTPRHESERYNRDAANLDLFAPVYGAALGQAVPAAFSWKSDMKRLGVYAQEQMKIADKWVVLLGARYDSVRYDQSAYFTGEKTVDNEKSRALTKRAGLVYLADDGLAPFVSYSESFQPTHGFDRTGARFKPGTGRQYEAGIRWQPRDGRTLVSAALYQLTRGNVTVADPIDANHAIQHGRVRSRGLELEARGRLTRNATVVAAYAYTDARTLRASPLQPDQVGKRSDGVPYHQWSVWADYRFGAFGLPGLKAGAGVRHVGEMRGVAHGTPVSVSAVTLVDAMISYDTGPWTLALNVSNLADKRYVANCTYGCFYGEPRKIIASAALRW